jgi:hypothetical protein
MSVLRKQAHLHQQYVTWRQLALVKFMSLQNVYYTIIMMFIFLYTLEFIIYAFELPWNFETNSCTACGRGCYTGCSGGGTGRPAKALAFFALGVTSGPTISIWGYSQKLIGDIARNILK